MTIPRPWNLILKENDGINYYQIIGADGTVVMTSNEEFKPNMELIVQAVNVEDQSLHKV